MRIDKIQGRRDDFMRTDRQTWFHIARRYGCWPGHDRICTPMPQTSSNMVEGGYRRVTRSPKHLTISEPGGAFALKLANWPSVRMP